MSVYHACGCSVCCAVVERMTVTTAAGDGTELAKDRLRHIAQRIEQELPVHGRVDAITSVLEQAAFDTFREGIILADQSVVEQLAVALATIEELEPYALLATKAMEAWAHEFHPGGRVAGLMLVGDHVLVKGPLLLIERSEEMRRRIEDLANDRAAADTEAAKLRGELEQRIKDREAAEATLRSQWVELHEADRNIKALNEEVKGLRGDVKAAEAEAERQRDACRALHYRMNQAVRALGGEA